MQRNLRGKLLRFPNDPDLMNPDKVFYEKEQATFEEVILIRQRGILLRDLIRR